MNHSQYFPPEMAENINPEQSQEPVNFYDPNVPPNEPQSIATSNLARWFGHGPHGLQPNQQIPKSTTRVRQRSSGSGDHVKHRRTRSGCYTCRSRRVKCGEEHPICERCRKGSRECVYPEPTTSARKATVGSKLGQPRINEVESGSSSGEYEDEEGEAASNAPSASQSSQKSPKFGTSLSNQRAAARKQSRAALKHAPNVASSDSLNKLKEKSLSPSTDDSGAFSKSQSPPTIFDRNSKKVSSISPGSSVDHPPWSHLRVDLQAHLKYHHDHLNYHYYFFKHDSQNFVHDILPNVALKYPPLLHALAGFSAYHQTVGKSHGRIPDFLRYYNEAVTLLRTSLVAGEKHTDETMLTVLQLAAFEEYLGDWVSLLSHQSYAKSVLLELYTPETIMETEVRRKILAWYARFDLFAGLMSGGQTRLGREWFDANDRYYAAVARNDPENIDLKIEAYIASHRVVAMDMAVLFAKLPRGAISMEDFLKENQAISDHLSNWSRDLDPALLNDEYRVKDFDGEKDPEDIVDPYLPGGLFTQPLWTVNYMIMDATAMNIMHQYQTAQLLQQPPPAHLAQLALEQCRSFEAIEFWPSSPPGAILPAQAGLGLAALFLPKDDRHTMWCRRKLAKVESMGYIYPMTFRTKMSQLWGLPDILKWWLSDDEGYPPIVRNIRSFITERHENPLPRSQEVDDVHNLKTIFSKMSFLETPKQSQENSPESSGVAGQSPPYSGLEQQPTGSDAYMDMESVVMTQPDVTQTGMGQQPMYGFQPQGNAFDPMDPNNPAYLNQFNTQQPRW